MKELSPGQDAARLALGMTIYRWIGVEWPAPVGTRYYAERDFAPDPGVEVERILLGFPSLTRTLPLGLKPESASGAAEFDVQMDADAEYPVDTILEDLVSAQGTRVTAYAAFKPATGALATTDWITLGTFALDSWTLISGVATLACVDWAAARGTRVVGTPITATEFPSAPEGSYGKIIPRIWGLVEGCPCYAVTAGRTAKLDGSLVAEETIIYVDDVGGWPTAGTIQIGDEKILYQAVDVVNRSFGTAASPAVRGYSGTTAADHSDGSVAREVLASYRFVVADHGCNNLADEAAVEVLVAGKAVTGTVAVEGGRTYIDLAELPVVREVSAAVAPGRLDGEDGGWTDGGSSSDSYVGGEIVANSAEGAIDGGGEQHVSMAILEPEAGKNLVNVEYERDQTNRGARFSRAWLEVDYKVVPGESGTGFAWGNPTIELLRAAQRVGLWNLGRPSAKDLEGYANEADITARIEDTRPLFEFTSGTVGNVEQQPALYVSGYAPTVAYSWPGQEADEYLRVTKWGLNTGGWTVGYPIPSGDYAQSLTVATANIRLSGIDFSVNVGSSWLVMRPDPVVAPSASERYSMVTGTVVIQRVDTSPGNAAIRLSIQGTDTDLTKNFPAGNDTQVTIAITKTGDFSKAEVEAARLYVYGTAGTVKRVSGVVTYTLPKIKALSSTVSCGTKPALRGQEEAAQGEPNTLANLGLLGGSRTLTQRCALTAHIKENYAANPWAFFNGALAAKVTADVGTAPTRILIYDVRFGIEERPETARQLTEDEAVLELDVEGLASGGNLIESPAGVIAALLTNADWWDLEAGDYDAAGLAAALTGRTGWKFARRFDRQVTCREALEQACRDAGIRFAFEGGRFVFAAMGLLPLAGAMALVRAEMMAPVEKRQAELSLLWNQIAVYFHRSLDDRRVFQRVTPDENAVGSQMLPVGLRRETLDAEWIRDNATAAAMAGVMLQDAAFPRTVAALEGALRWIPLELGDVVEITDADAGMDGAVGRVCGLSYPGNTIRATALVTAGFKRFWTDPGDGTNFVNVYFGARQFAFFIAGTRVAVLTGNGLWRLKGGLETGMTGGTQTGVLAMVDGGIGIGVLESGTMYTGLVITADGDLQVFEANVGGEHPPAALETADYVDQTTAYGTALSSDMQIVLAIVQGGVALGRSAGQATLWGWGVRTGDGEV